MYSVPLLSKLLSESGWPIDHSLSLHSRHCIGNVSSFLLTCPLRTRPLRSPRGQHYLLRRSPHTSTISWQIFSATLDKSNQILSLIHENIHSSIQNEPLHSIHFEILYLLKFNRSEHSKLTTIHRIGHILIILVKLSYIIPKIYSFSSHQEVNQL